MSDKKMTAKEKNFLWWWGIERDKNDLLREINDLKEKRIDLKEETIDLQDRTIKALEGQLAALHKIISEYAEWMTHIL